MAGQTASRRVRGGPRVRAPPPMGRVLAARAARADTMASARQTVRAAQAAPTAVPAPTGNRLVRGAGPDGADMLHRLGGMRRYPQRVALCGAVLTLTVAG